MEQLHRWLSSTGGRIIVSVVALAAVVAAGVAVRTFVGGDTPDSAHYSMFICTETGKVFRHRNQLGDVHPILSPHSGKSTGVIAEPCFWTAAGGTKPEPTWVLLNEAAGKAGATFCPDCGRLVVGHNPAPGPGVPNPPTI